jgi:crotonobetainyl-CoA:carnitine CoA-transferase CaiB-like acyl-CoA transferase
VKNRSQLIELLNDLFASKTVEEWLLICEKATVPAAPINDIEHVFQDPQVVARDLVTKTEIDGETVRMLASPMKIPESPTSVRFPPPKLGQHSQEILIELFGYSANKISDLQAKKII